MLNEEIGKLDELKAQGIISDEEYELKKKELYDAYPSSNRTTSSGSKKFEIFASLSYFLGIPSIIITAFGGLLLMMGIFLGFSSYKSYENGMLSFLIGYIGFWLGALSLCSSIPALIFGKISSKGVIVNFNRSKAGTNLSLIAIIVSAIIIVAGIVAVFVFLALATSGIRHYGF
jgi:hypothetical protein